MNISYSLILFLMRFLSAQIDCADYFTVQAGFIKNMTQNSTIMNYINITDAMVNIINDCYLNQAILIINNNSKASVSIIISADYYKKIISNYSIIIQGFQEININNLIIQSVYIGLLASNQLNINNVTITKLTQLYITPNVTNNFVLLYPKYLIVTQTQILFAKYYLKNIEDNINQTYHSDYHSYNQIIRTQLPCSIYLEGQNITLNNFTLSNLSSNSNLYVFDDQTMKVFRNTLITMNMSTIQNLLNLVSTKYLILSNVTLDSCTSFYSSGSITRSSSMITIYANKITQNNLTLINSLLLRSKFMEIKILGTYSCNNFTINNCTTLLTQLITIDQMANSNFSSQYPQESQVSFNYLTVTNTQMNNGLPMEKFLSYSLLFKYTAFISVNGKDEFTSQNLQISNNIINPTNAFHFIDVTQANNVSIINTVITNNQISSMLMDFFSVTYAINLTVTKFDFDNLNKRDLGQIKAALFYQASIFDQFLTQFSQSFNGQPTLISLIQNAYYKLMPIGIFNNFEVQYHILQDIKISSFFVVTFLMIQNIYQPVKLDILRGEFSNQIKKDPLGCENQPMGFIIRFDGPILGINISDCKFKNLNIFNTPLIQITSLGEQANIYQNTTIALSNLTFENIDLIIVQNHVIMSLIFLNTEPLGQIIIRNITFLKIYMHSIPQLLQSAINLNCVDNKSTLQLQYENVDLSAPLIFIISTLKRITIDQLNAQNVQIIISSQVTSKQNYGGLYLSCENVSISNSQFLQFNSNNSIYPQNLDLQSLGGCLYTKSTNLLIETSIFSDLVFVQGAAISAYSTSIILQKIRFSNIYFYSKYDQAAVNGGAILIKNTINLMVNETIFQNIQQGFQGGIISFSSTQIKPNMWNFNKIKILIPSQIVSVEESAYFINFIDFSQDSNSFTQLNITNLMLIGQNQILSTLISIIKTNLTLIDTIIMNLQFSRNFIIVQQASQIYFTLQDTTFSNLTFSQNDQNFSPFQFKNQDRVIISLNRSYFFNIKSITHSQPLFQQVNNSSTTIILSTFQNFQNIYLINQENCTSLNISNSIFRKFIVRGLNFTLMLIKNSQQVNITNSNLIQFRGQQLNNTGIIGYAIMIIETQASFVSSKFLQNQGGIIFFSFQNPSIQQPLNFTSNNQIKQCDSIGPAIIIMFPNVSSDMYDIENLSNIAFFPNQLKLDFLLYKQEGPLSTNSVLYKNQTLIQNLGLNNSNFTLQVYPGSSLYIQVDFQQNFGILTKQYFVSVYPEININFSMNRQISYQAILDQDTYEYQNQNIPLVTNNFQQGNISLYIQSINYTNMSFLIFIDLNFTACEAGEVLVDYGNCQECPTSTCSYDGKQCYRCPDHSNCSKGIIIALEAGYWRINNQSIDVVACYNQQSNCQSVNDPKVGSICKEGTRGPLCETCDFYGLNTQGQKYFRSSKYSCEQCSRLQDNTYKYITVAGFSVLVLILSMQITSEGVFQSVQQDYLKKMGFLTLGITGMVFMVGSYIKIIVTHFQIFSVIKTFVDTDYLSLLLGVGYVSGEGLTQFAFSFDCFITSIFGSYYSVQLSILIFQSLLPIVIFSSQSIILVIICLIRGKRINKQEFIFSWFYIYFFMITALSQQLILFSSCRIIGDQSYSEGNLNQQCFGQKHVQTFLQIVLPLMIFYLLIIPLLGGFQRLRQNHKQKKLHRIYFIQSMGFLYLEYIDDVYYFEFIKFTEKILVTLISNQFDDNHLYMSQSLIILLIVIQFITQRLKPYEYFRLVVLDQRSSLVLSFSILIASMSENSQQSVQIISLSTITTLNILFILSFIKDIIKIILLQHDDLIYPFKKKLYTCLKMEINDTSRALFIRQKWQIIYRMVYKIKKFDVPHSSQKEVDKIHVDRIDGIFQDIFNEDQQIQYSKSEVSYKNKYFY